MIAVLVTTDKDRRGVFFGYVESEDQAREALASAGGVLKLFNARNCIYWSKDVHGVFGLASRGPTSGCRIGPKVLSLLVSGLTAVARVSEEAARAWEDEPWS